MFLCVRDEWRQGQTATLSQLLLLTIARCVIFKNPLSTSSASWLGLLNRGSLRATTLSLQTGPHSGLPDINWLSYRRHLPIFFHNSHLLPLLLPLIYTGASLDWRLDQGSIYNICTIRNSSRRMRYTDLRDFVKETDHQISARQPDLVIVNKKNENLPNSELCRPGGAQSENKRKRKER